MPGIPVEKKEDQRWEKMQEKESIDLLFSKLEAQDETKGRWQPR
jgi:hypothetical protein